MWRYSSLLNAIQINRVIGISCCRKAVAIFPPFYGNHVFKMNANEKFRGLRLYRKHFPHCAPICLQYKFSDTLIAGGFTDRRVKRPEIPKRFLSKHKLISLRGVTSRVRANERRHCLEFVAIIAKNAQRERLTSEENREN